MTQTIFLKHPDSGEIHSLSEWAQKIGVANSTISTRYKRYNNDIRKVLKPSRLSHSKLWTKEEDEFLEVVCFAPNLHHKWNVKAQKMGWQTRSKSALNSRIFILQQRNQIPITRNNSIDAVASGWLNISQLASYLGVSDGTIRNFIANGCQSEKCLESGQIKISLKKFVAWATKPDGAALVAKAIKNDELALNWLLVEIGNWR